MKLNEPYVITVSREIGSGGRTVGRKLAARLGVRYSDKQLVDSLKEKFNLSVSSIERLKGEKKNWLSELIQHVAPVPKISEITNVDGRFVQGLRKDVTASDVFSAEKEILNAIADEGSCVIAGRSGFFVLKDRPQKVDIFITASRDKRIERVMQKQGLTREQAAAVVDSVDDTRENYIRRYAGVSRYDARNYDLSINMDFLSEDEAVELILRFLGT
ncbi:MAG: cytidylate kinase-like family protein [Bacteroidales bacterium]|nr:cytidylate kinase-like family protein [Bacteroidales bacterium]